MSNESDRESEGGLNPRPKREPPVIDADAKDVTPSSQESAAKPVSDAGPMLKNAKNIEWRTTLPAIGVAALCGVAAGLFGAWLFSSSAPQSADASAINNSIAQLSSRLTQQETKTQPAPDLTPLSERSAKLETATGELRANWPK